MPARRVLLVASIDIPERVLDLLRVQGLEVDIIKVPDVIFRPPSKLLETISKGWEEAYDKVVVPGSYPWDLSHLGGKIVKGPEAPGLLPEAIAEVGLDGLSPSLSFEKAHPEALSRAATKTLSRLRAGDFLSTSPPPVRVLAEIMIDDDDDVDEIKMSARQVASDGADAVVLAPVGGNRSQRTSLEALRGLKGSMSVVLGLDGPTELLREAVKAGATLLLSLKALKALDEDLSWAKDSYVVLLAEDEGDIEAADRAVRRLKSIGVRPVLDPVATPPVSPGLRGTIDRLHMLSSIDAPKMIGVSNVVELMDADTSGSTALMVSLAAELGVSGLLVEEASPKARGLVSEARAAADMAMLSLAWLKPPKDLGVSLLEGKVKLKTIEVSGVTIRLEGRDEVVVNYMGMELKASCRGDYLALVEQLGLSGRALAEVSVALYRACLPWSSGKPGVEVP